MGVFKEHANSFETVERKSAQIYNDSCDYGLSYNTDNPPYEIHNLIRHVKDLRGSSLIKSRQEHVSGVDITIRIAWEIDEGFECGSEYNISFNRISGPSRINKEHNAFISVTSKRYTEPLQRII